MYILRDANGQALYVGKAGDLQKRVRSYFGSRRQKPALEAALGALARVDTVPFGSELEAALVELELIRAWRPPANSRSTRPERGRYLRLGIADPVPLLALRDAPREDGALYAGPLASRRTAETALEALRDAFGLRTCRPKVPADEGTCLRGAWDAAWRPVAGRRRQRTTPRPSGGSSGTWKGAARAGAPRCEPASQASWPRSASRRRRAGSAISRRSIASMPPSPCCAAPGRATACCSRRTSSPALVRCLAVRGGRALGWRSLPRRGDPSAAIGSVLHELARPLDDKDGAPGPWLPADEAEAAAILTAAFAGRAPGVVPIATSPQMDARVVLQRVAEARARVPERAAVRREDRRDWRSLHQVEPPTGLRLATG